MSEFFEALGSVFADLPWRKWLRFWAWAYVVTAVLVGLLVLIALLGTR